MRTIKLRPSLYISIILLVFSLSGNNPTLLKTSPALRVEVASSPIRWANPSPNLVNSELTATPEPELITSKSASEFILKKQTQNLWIIIQINHDMELIPGIGLRTTAIFSQDGIQVKAYCLDPGMPIPPVNTQCSRDENGIFHCKDHQRFKVLPTSPTPTPELFDCARLGLGLHVVYGKETSAAPAKLASLHLEKTSNFWLDPLAVAPDEIWYDVPIRMRTPFETCGKFTVFGKSDQLPPEVVDVEVFVDCPGIHLDLSSEAADGNYCFGCRGIHFSQNICTVTNRLFIEKDDQAFVCQAFYQVIDP